MGCVRLLAESDIFRENGPLRMYIALRMLRAWDYGTEGYDALVLMAVWRWMDGGMKGPILWPESPFFNQWAQENGLARVGDYVGFRFEVAFAATAKR
jgi:hypothetical protein